MLKESVSTLKTGTTFIRQQLRICAKSVNEAGNGVKAISVNAYACIRLAGMAFQLLASDRGT